MLLLVGHAAAVTSDSVRIGWHWVGQVAQATDRWQDREKGGASRSGLKGGSGPQRPAWPVWPAPVGGRNRGGDPFQRPYIQSPAGAVNADRLV